MNRDSLVKITVVFKKKKDFFKNVLIFTLKHRNSHRSVL